jgi:uncharacterized membrane protein
MRMLAEPSEGKSKVVMEIEKNLEGLDQNIRHHVPRYAFFVSILIIGLLFSVLSDNITLGSSWFILSVAFLLFIPLAISISRGHQQRVRVIAIIIICVVTIGLICSVTFLIYALFTNQAKASSLFRDAVVLWLANIAVFGVWYWEIDQGGPFFRHLNRSEPIDLLFPQMISDSPIWVNWKPGYLDYLFFAFNTSTAFSPTDTMVMSRRAKLLMITQASISLVIIAVLAARAVNIA